MIGASLHESSILKVSIGRGTLAEGWDWMALRKEVLDGRYDFVRLKMPSADEELFEKLEQLGMPYCILSILVRNSITITAQHELPAIGQRLQFNLFDGSNEAEVKELVKKSYGNRTSVFYHNPYYRNWVSYEDEMEAAAMYAVTFVYAKNPRTPHWLVKKDNQIIGFVLGIVDNNTLEGIMYSVLPEYRGHNYAADIMAYLKSWCWLNNIGCFANHVPLQNLPSLRNIVAQAILPVDSFINITLSCMLSATNQPAQVFTISPPESHQKLHQWILALAENWQQNGFVLSSLKLGMAKQDLPHVTQVKVTLPFANSITKLYLLTLFNGNKLLGTAYVTLSIAD
jgi:predicted acetyltransferase